MGLGPVVLGAGFGLGAGVTAVQPITWHMVALQPGTCLWVLLGLAFVVLVLLVDEPER